MSTVKAGSEAAFQQQVIQLAGFYSWRVYHTHDSRRSQKGFPDLVLVRGAELIFAELKTDKGRVRPEQQEWIQALQAVSEELVLDLEQLDHVSAASVDVYLWRPRDFDELHARLARGRRQVQPTYREDAAA